MVNSIANAGRQALLVTDFDGTMTRHDFFKLAIERLLPADVPNYWADYRSGRSTHFDALRQYFAAIRRDEQEILSVVQQMELDPMLSEAVEALRKAGWDVIVTSAGCDWYIRRLLAGAGVEVTVYANPGRFDPNAGLLMDRPGSGPFYSHQLGVDKAAVVRHHLALGTKVAFAGDGFPDADAARLVPAQLRFARGDLAHLLREEQLEFQPFDVWSEIPRRLLSGGA